MNRNELRKADINLMVVFETLMLERNVTRVAEKLFLGQPTISSALNRLRTMLNDPLFIRVGHRMEPTARAEEYHSVTCQAGAGFAVGGVEPDPRFRSGRAAP